MEMLGRPLELAADSAAGLHHCGLRTAGHFVRPADPGALERPLQPHRPRTGGCGPNAVADHWGDGSVATDGHHGADGGHCVQLSALL